MDKRLLQTYSVWAKDNLEKQVEVSLKTLGINGDKDIKPARKVGDFTVIEGDPNSYPADLKGKRDRIAEMIRTNGYKNVIEEYAYTWFNRIIALRFMEVHDFLSHGFRVLSNRSGGIEPEILKNVGLVKFDLGLDAGYCGKLRDEGKIEELFRYVLLKQCNALSGILPMLFSKEGDYTELLLPKTLLKGETVITKLLEIPEDNFLNDVEIIGWMYQFYISVKKDEVFASKKTITKDTLPAVTQLFTPDWIVRYMAENSVGRIWLESYPNSSLREEMKYYVTDPEQPEEVQRKIDAIKYRNINPEDIRIIEPCCGSGHILVYVFDLLFKMYEEKGYQKRDIPTLILKNNLTGLDVDKRAAQLAAFSLVMKARSVNNQFFNEKYYVLPRVYEFYDSHALELMGYQSMLKETGVLSVDDIKEFTQLVSTFKNGKTIGSLLKVKPMNFVHMEENVHKMETEVVQNIFLNEFFVSGLPVIKSLITLAKVLSAKYDVMITNPPYIGISTMESSVKEYAIKEYPNSKADMFAMFMETGFVKPNGFTAMINMHSWMFLSSYEYLRKSILCTREIVNMVHLGAHAFETISGEVVQTVSFVFRSSPIDVFAKFYRLIETANKEQAFLKYNNEYICCPSRFLDISGTPIAYWISTKMANCFELKKVRDRGDARQGMATGDNEKFLRLWHEVQYDLIGFNLRSYDQFSNSNYKYAPFIKSNGYRRWFGNCYDIIKFDAKNYKLLSNSGNKLPSKQYYFLNCASWNAIGTDKLGCRLSNYGGIFSNSSHAFFADDLAITYACAYFNSIVLEAFVKVLSPTVNYNSGIVENVPFLIAKEEIVVDTAKENIAIAKKDWDSFESSWDYLLHPLIRWSKELWDATAIGATMFHYYNGHPKVSSPLELCYMLWQGECKERFQNLKANEEELNRIFIEIYGLQDELTPEVEDKDVTVRLADKERDIKSLISYLVGIIMGRYSLDVEGLAYAGGEWNSNKYVTYQPDDDGIVPIYTDLGMKDGLDTRIINLIKQIYGANTYRENIDFIAEALGKKNSESSEETLNRYLNEGFYADHLKIYQKRPIYWMFSSGKNSGFKCLIYMHRYNSDTLARINGKYFLPESTRLKNELDELLATIESSEGRDRIRLEKERQRLADKYREAIEYGQILDHMANKYIDIDLDDGVKVNYAKFQGVELVTDNGTKVKKDLLVPIK